MNKVDFQQLLDNWGDLLMLHVQVARLEASLVQTLASLERVVGCELASTPATQPAPADDDSVFDRECPVLTPVPVTAEKLSLGTTGE